MKRSMLVRVGLIVATSIALIFGLYELVLAATATANETILFHTQIILAVVQGATFVFLAITVWLTYMMAVASRRSTEVAERGLQYTIETREADTAPRIFVYFELPYQSKFIYFVIKNVGITPANGINLAFDPPINSTDDLFDGFAPIRNGVPSLGSGQEIRTFFDLSFEYLNSQLPQTYKVKLTYQGGLDGKHYKETQTIDLSMYMGRAWIGEEKKEDIEHSVSSIAQSLQEIVGVLKNDPGLLTAFLVRSELSRQRRRNSDDISEG